MRPWRTLRSQQLLDRSPWLRVLADEIELPDGRVVKDYLRLETPDYAVIVPVDERGRLGLIRSYKRGPDAIDLQPPAGTIETGELPLETARRELLEETGCTASDWTSLGHYVLMGNMRGGSAHLFLATGCRQVAEPNSGDLEEQEVLWLPQAEVARLWRGGQLGQLGAVAALGLALAELDTQTA
ncbi:MAG TPA: NUDIX hydrolase [Anaerolineales bacterium]|jgi:ADP-ribose pyrophosphatase